MFDDPFWKASIRILQIVVDKSTHPRYPRTQSLKSRKSGILQLTQLVIAFHAAEFLGKCASFDQCIETFGKHADWLTDPCSDAGARAVPIDAGAYPL